MERGERSQEPEGRRREKRRRRGEERERNRADARQGGYRDEDNLCEEVDNGGAGARRMGPGTPQTGKQQRRRGGYRTRGGGQEDSADESAEWSGDKLEGLATEEEATSAGGAGWERETRTVMSWRTQDSGEVGLPGDVMAGEGDTGKAASAAADETGEQGRHGARPANRGGSRGRRGKQAGKTLGVQGDDGGRKASGVAHDSPGVGDKEGGIEASGVAENPWGYCQGGSGGVESPQGNGTPGVTDLPLGDKNPGVATKAERVVWGGRTGAGRGQKPPHHPSKRGEQCRRRQQGHEVWAEDGAAAAPTEGHGSGRRQCRSPAAEIRRRQAPKLQALAP